MVQFRGHAFLLGRAGHQFGHFGQQGAEAELGFLQLELARFHLGEIEDVIDQRDQRARGIPGDVDELLLALGEAGFLEHVEHADHAVERRAHLMG